MTKTNATHLREILKTEVVINHEEAEEFLDAIEEEISDLQQDIRDLNRELELKKTELNELEEEIINYGKADFVGLDTIQWSLKNGNLKVQEQMEAFIERLKTQNCATIS